MNALFSALIKFITIIIAVLIPATQVSPQVGTIFYGQAEAYSIQNEAAETEEGEELDIVEEENDIEEPVEEAE